MKPVKVSMYVVQGLMDEGKSDEQIMKILRIKKPSLTGYKSRITRAKNLTTKEKKENRKRKEKRSASNLETLAVAQGTIQIPINRIRERLDDNEEKEFVGYIEKILDEDYEKTSEEDAGEEGLTNDDVAVRKQGHPTYGNNLDFPDDGGARDVLIHAIVAMQLENGDLYNLEALKKRDISKGSIASYLANWRRGAYNAIILEKYGERKFEYSERRRGKSLSKRHKE